MAEQSSSRMEPQSPASDAFRETPILRPGETCWLMEKADRVALIVDAADYFTAAKEAILQARHSIYLIGWDFDLRIRLDPRADDQGVPDQLGRFITHAVSRRPALRAYILQWDAAMLYTIARQLLPFLAFDWFTHRRVRFRFDSEHPVGACHHQKIVVIDDSVAFCGGIDMTDDRWDTRDHLDGDPRRRRPNGSAYGPWHDVTMAVDGQVAAELGEIARERWQRATGERLERPRRHSGLWPQSLPVDLRDVDVAVARTFPPYRQQPRVAEIEQLYRDAIAAAREVIYIESQYFASGAICDALIERLSEPDGPEVVVVNPLTAEGWLESTVMDSARSRAVSALRAADKHGRFRIYYPCTRTRSPIYVHAKVLTIDDRLLRIGSSNINNRSLGFDSECDLAIEARPKLGQAAVREAISDFRDKLLAEHLNVGRADLRAARQASGGSLVGAIDRLCSPSGRSLCPLEPKSLNGLEEALVSSGLANPEPSQRRESRLKHFVKHALQPYHTPILIASGLLAGFLSAKAIRQAAKRRGLAGAVRHGERSRRRRASRD